MKRHCRNGILLRASGAGAGRGGKSFLSEVGCLEGYRTLIGAMNLPLKKFVLGGADPCSQLELSQARV